MQVTNGPATLAQYTLAPSRLARYRPLPHNERTECPFGIVRSFRRTYPNQRHNEPYARISGSASNDSA